LTFKKFCYTFAIQEKQDKAVLNGFLCVHKKTFRGLDRK